MILCFGESIITTMRSRCYDPRPRLIQSNDAVFKKIENALGDV